MDESKDKEPVREEIRREFQLERMVLFSDAVFAIVITLMAIEIHIPEIGRIVSGDELKHELIKLLPNIIAYAASFFFIGFTWYQHLQVFSLLKDYDKGLVIRNLVMLFFIGLFPFSASLVASTHNGIFLTIFIYFSIIVLCRTAQLILHHYILVKRPQLRLNADTSTEMLRFKKSRLALALIIIMFFLVSATTTVLDPEYKPLAWWWFFPFPLALRYFQRRIK